LHVILVLSTNDLYVRVSKQLIWRVDLHGEGLMIEVNFVPNSNL